MTYDNKTHLIKKLELNNEANKDLDSTGSTIGRKEGYSYYTHCGTCIPIKECLAVSIGVHSDEPRAYITWIEDQVTCQNCINVKNLNKLSKVSIV